MGIFGHMAAGAVEGTGKAIADIGKQWSEAQHQDFLNEAQATRQRSLEEVRAGHQAGLQQSGFEHAKTMQKGQQEFSSGQQQARFGQEESMLQARQAFEREQSEAQRTLTREQIAANERIASANRKNALEIANVGGSIQQDKDGNVIFVGKDGRSAYIPDPDKPDQPLRGHKDMTPSQKALSDLLKSQMVELERAEANPMTDDKTRAAIGQRRTQVMAEFLNVIGGIGTAGQNAPTGRTGWDSSSGQVMFNGRTIGTAKSESDARRMVEDARSKSDPLGIRGGSKPPQAAIDALRKDPSLSDQFHNKYGVDPNTYLEPSRFGGARPAAPAASGGAVQRIVPELRTGAQARKSPKEKFVDAQQRTVARNESARKERVADTFRSILEIGNYTPEDRDLIKAAVQSGFLTPSEQQIARRMLDELESQSGFEHGYETAARRGRR